MGFTHLLLTAIRQTDFNQTHNSLSQFEISSIELIVFNDIFYICITIEFGAMWLTLIEEPWHDLFSSVLLFPRPSPSLSLSLVWTLCTFDLNQKQTQHTHTKLFEKYSVDEHRIIMRNVCNVKLLGLPCWVIVLQRILASYLPTFCRFSQIIE